VVVEDIRMQRLADPLREHSLGEIQHAPELGDPRGEASHPTGL
jgi:hypothetical protein